MRLKWGHLSMGVRDRWPLLSIGGIFDAFDLPEAGRTDFPPFYIPLAIEAHANEVSDDQTLDLELRDPSGITRSIGKDLPLRWRSLGPGHPRLALGALSVASGWWLSGPGRYQVLAHVNGMPVEGRIEFYGRRPGGRLSTTEAASDVPETGCLLEWAHLCFQVRPDEKGFVWYEDITDFYPTPRDDAMTFNGFLVMLLSFGSTEGHEHRTRVEFTSPDGRVLRQFNENPIRAETAGPGHWYKALCLMTVNNLIVPGPGDYAFRIFADGRPAGTLEYPVIRVPDRPVAP
jgi:hypothetical protein